MSTPGRAHADPRWYPAPLDHDSPVVAVATAFVPRVRGLFAALGLVCDRFTASVEPCIRMEEQTGRQVLYYMYVSARAYAPNANVEELLEALRGSWQRAGWRIERFQRTGSGGVSIAGVEPVNGHRYALDSGMKTDPEGMVTGFFTTPSHSAPIDIVRFGALHD